MRSTTQPLGAPALSKSFGGAHRLMAIAGLALPLLFALGLMIMRGGPAERPAMQVTTPAARGAGASATAPGLAAH